MTAAEIVAAAGITDVWLALGGDTPKLGRARAFYRDGDNPQAVSLNATKGAWFDHRDNVGGGILDLVQKVRGVSRTEALHWVANFIGATLDKKPLSLHGRRRLAALKQRAEQLARECVWWTRAYSAALETTKAAAFQREDIAKLAWAARELYWLQSNPSSDVLARYLKTRDDAPDEVLALVEEGRHGEEDAILITVEVVMMLARSQGTDRA